MNNIGGSSPPVHTTSDGNVYVFEIPEYIVVILGITLIIILGILAFSYFKNNKK